MKKIILLVLSLGIAVFMSGCLSRAVHYNNASMNKVVKENLTQDTKISTNVILVQKNLPGKQIPNRYIDGPRTGNVTLKFNTSAIANNVTKKFLHQYFTKVSTSYRPTKANIELRVEIKDMKLEYVGQKADYLEASFLTEVQIYSNGSKVFEKEYFKERVPSNTYLMITSSMYQDTIYGQMAQYVIYDLLEQEIKPELVEISKKL